MNEAGQPVDSGGQLLRDPDGLPLPPAPRTRVCDRVQSIYGINTTVDGAWYRCCGGKVRKLTDCCSYSSRRVNGDAALTGYCYRGPQGLLRHVLRHARAVLIEISLAAAALLIGATGTFSPCGLSVVETIGPTGHTGGRRTTVAACIAFVPGALAGG